MMTLLAALALSASANAVTVSDAGELARALEAAKGGEIITLAPGDYGALQLKSRQFAKSVTIAAADPARAPRFKSIFLKGVSNLAFDGVELRLGPARPLLDYAVTVLGSSHVSFRHFDVASAPDGVAGNDGYGFMLRGSDHVMLEKGAVHDVFRGVASFDNADVTISNVAFSRMGSDGIVARGALRLTIASNFFTDAALVDAKRWHPDAIQLWSRGASRANEGITIRGNVIRRGKGDATQGVFIKSPEIASKNILIENNLIVQSLWQGICVQNGDGVVIRGNTVKPARPGDRPGIEVRAPFRNAHSEYNVAASWRLAPGVTSVGDVDAGRR